MHNKKKIVIKSTKVKYLMTNFYVFIISEELEKSRVFFKFSKIENSKKIIYRKNKKMWKMTIYRRFKLLTIIIKYLT